MRKLKSVRMLVAVVGGMLLVCGTAQPDTLELYSDFGGTQAVWGQSTFDWSYDLSAFSFLSASYTSINSATLEVWVQNLDTNANIPQSTNYQYYTGNLADLLIGEADSGSTPLASPLTTLFLQPGSGLYSYLQDGDFLAEVQVNETNNWRVVGSQSIGHYEWRQTGQYWVQTGWNSGYWAPIYSQVWVYDYTRYFYNPSYDGYLSLLTSHLTIDYTIDTTHPDYPTGDITPVPEPATMILGGIGMAGVAFVRGRRKRN